MVDLPPHDEDREQVNPLPNDSPVFMVETHFDAYDDALSLKGIRKGFPRPSAVRLSKFAKHRLELSLSLYDLAA